MSFFINLMKNFDVIWNVYRTECFNIKFIFLFCKSCGKWSSVQRHDRHNLERNQKNEKCRIVKKVEERNDKKTVSSNQTKT